MDRNITNCIQKTWTESSNMIIFGTNIRTHFRYICYLDIYRLIYIKTELIQTQKNTTQNQHLNL